MPQPDFSLPVKHFVELLIAEDYQAVIEHSFHKECLQALWLAEAIHSYPGQLTTPPVSAYEAMDVYKYDDGSGYMLEFFLWVDHEPSDLLVKVEAIQVDDKLYYTLWDILVP
jgi:hypothetical protein